MSKSLLVSVIITTKNEETRIEALLVSLKIQTYKNIEVIVVDNNSTDKTKQICKKYTKKVYNKGPERSVQRNFGVSKAKGAWVLILDADMELTPKVVESCLDSIDGNVALIVPERTVGDSLIAKLRAFEREMYMGDPTVEVARFFKRRVFLEFGGYDPDLTGPEDYDLPYRISKKHEIGWSKEYILHRETELTLRKLLGKKYYYAKRGALYAEKHPELVGIQGNMLFRKAYIRNWKRFVREPVVGSLFMIVRILETAWAVAGYISAVGVFKFFKVFTRTCKEVIKKEKG